MDPEEEAMLANLIGRDMQQLKDRTSEAGVLAYARQPVPRDRPNERFLQNTLRNLGQANRRADEQAMWASRQRQLELDDPDTSRHQKRRKESSPAASTNASAPSGSATSSDQIEPVHRPGNLSDEDLANMLARKGVRGRGGIGSRAQETGPYLPGSLAGEPRVAGPAKPPWLQSDEDATDVSASALQAERWLQWQQEQDLQKQASNGKATKHKAKKKKKAKLKETKHPKRHNTAT